MDPSSLVTGLMNFNPATRLLNKETGKDVAPSKFGYMGTRLMSNTSTMNEIINYAILAFALYIAFKCKKDGKIDFIQLILAICCSPCYVAYRLVRPCNKF